MIGSTYDAAFGVETLTAMIKTFDTSAYDKFFSDLFRKSTITPLGESVTWDEVRMDRDLAPVTGPDSPAPRVKNLDRVRRQEYLASIKLYSDISGRKLYKERAPGSLLPNAEEVIANEIQNMRLKIQKTINYISVNLLLGALDINPVNIPGTEITIPTINPGVATYAKSQPWNNKATQILSIELNQFVSGPTGYVATAGRFPGLAIINNSVEGYLIQNSEIQEWLKFNFGSSVGFSNPASSEVLSGMALGGLKWTKNVHGYVPTGTTTFTKFMPDDTVVLVPPEEELGEVLAMAEGYGIVPRNAYGTETANGIVDLAPSPGFYSYATAIENPVGVRLYAGWLGLPVIKFPKAVNVGKVV
ncbi:MAG TPA: major capsid protein [Planctomycetota bacterium]|nr:major capsid protein [Planctomycetota bacterium]